MNKKILITIITYNNIKTIIPCLDSLNKQTYKNFDLFILDNNSSDQTVSLMKEFLRDHKQLAIKTEIMESKKNIGFAKGVNIGIKKALKKENIYTILLLNSDTYFTEDLLANGINTLEENSEIGAALPKILYPDGKVWWMGTKVLSNSELLLTPTYSITKHINKGENIKFNNNQIITIDALTGCAVFIKVDAIKQTGLFDEKYFMYAEDIDYSNRLKKQNYKISLFTSGTVFHGVQDKKMDMKTVRSSLRKYKIYLKSVGIYLLYNKPFYIFFIWLLKLPYALIYNYYKRR